MSPIRKNHTPFSLEFAASNLTFRMPRIAGAQISTYLDAERDSYVFGASSMFHDLIVNQGPDSPDYVLGMPL